MTSRSEHLRGLAMTTVGVLILTPDSLLVRLIQADTWTLLFWRGLANFAVLATIAFVLYGAGAVGRFRALGRHGAWTAVLFVASTLFFVTSLRNTAVANTLVIVAAAPLFAAVLSHLFLKEATPPRTWAAIAVGFGAIAYMMADSVGQPCFRGDLAALATALAMAGALVMMRRSRGENALPTVAVSGLLLALVTLMPAQPLSLQGSDVLYIAVLGLVVVPFSFVLALSGPKYLPAPEVALIFLLETVLGPLWVWLVTEERPPEAAFVGGGVLIATLVVHAWLGLRAGR